MVPRRLLARIHGYTRERRRAEVRPISQEEWPSFLETWWHATPGPRRHGRAGVAEVIEQLQGFEWQAGDWERLFAERLESYRPEWLDDLCLSGEVVWAGCPWSTGRRGRRSAAGEPRRSGKTPSPDSHHLHAEARSALAASGSPRACGAEANAGSGREVLGTAGARRPVSFRAPGDHRSPPHGHRGGLVGRRRSRTLECQQIQRRALALRSHPVPPPPAAESPPGSRGRRGTWRQGVEGRWALLPGASARLRIAPSAWRGATEEGRVEPPRHSVSSHCRPPRIASWRAGWSIIMKSMNSGTPASVALPDRSSFGMIRSTSRRRSPTRAA